MQWIQLPTCTTCQHERMHRVLGGGPSKRTKCDEWGPVYVALEWYGTNEKAWRTHARAPTRIDALTCAGPNPVPNPHKDTHNHVPGVRSTPCLEPT